MEMALALGREDTNSVDEGKITEDKILTEKSLEKLGGGFGSRLRKKSKYLSPPYINIEPKQKILSAEGEDLRIHGSSSYPKLGNKKFRRNWNIKFANSVMSLNPELMNVSAAKLLSGLRSAAVDCMFSVGNMTFDLVEEFFSRHRISNYHDEVKVATSQFNKKEEKMGKPIDGHGKPEKNANTCIGDFVEPERKLKQKENVEEVTTVLHESQDVETNLDEGLNVPKERENIEAPQNAHIRVELPDLNVTVTEGNSLNTVNSEPATGIPDLNAPCVECDSFFEA